MARFEVFRNSGAHADDVPYLLDVQSDLLHGLETRVVVPLRRRDRFPASRVPQRLTPVFEIEGIACLLETPKLAAVRVAPAQATGAITGQRANHDNRRAGFSVSGLLTMALRRLRFA